MKKIKVLMFVVIVMALVVSCGNKGEPVLKVAGLLEKTYTQKGLETMDMVESEYTNKDGETSVFTGIPIVDILTDAGAADFSKVTIAAFDGYTAEVSSEELQDCSGCILTMNDDSSWQIVMPGFSSKLQVKNVVEFIVE